MREVNTCSYCDKGEHELCCGLIDHTGGIEFDCECSCQAKYRGGKTVCNDCGDLITTFRPDCHSMYSSEIADLLREDEESEMQGQIGPTVGEAEKIFPFTLEDLAYWVVKRKDGVTVKYTVVGPGDRMAGTTVSNSGGTSNWSKATNAAMSQTGIVKSLGAWCHHDPKGEPIWDGGKVRIWIADAVGCRSHYHQFDYVLDCGDILTLSTLRTWGKLEGDEGLTEVLEPFVIGAEAPTHVLKIDWDDRKAPPLDITAWAALAKHFKEVEGSILTACQGGHGRSGTSLVCLMMALNPEYTPYDAVVHLRAMHCPRAIESKEQHEYINEVGIALGRKGNVAEVGTVTNFKEAFLSLKLKSAKKYQERLKGEGK